MNQLVIGQSELISCCVERGRMIVRFASPQTRNPLSTNVFDHLETIVRRCETDQRIAEIIFTGAGDVFASGADLREIGALDAERARAFSLRGQSLMSHISLLEQRTTAAINGFCFGGALDLALACDSRIASEFATFCHPGASLGIITGWGGTQRLPRLIGEALACELFFTAEPVSAETALSIGLIDCIDDEFVAKFDSI